MPFYVALPSSTIDWGIVDALNEIPIETRSPSEILEIEGQLTNGEIGKVRICPSKSQAFNPAFDVTPSELITGLITERGVTAPDELALQKLLKSE